jgi:DNA-damage-inducible protein J
MPTTAMLHVRVDERTKEAATQTLEALGLSLSDAVRLFLNRVVIEQGMPISFKLPNAKTRAAIAEAKTIVEPRFDNVEDLIRDLEKTAKPKKGKASVKD